MRPPSAKASSKTWWRAGESSRQGRARELEHEFFEQRLAWDRHLAAAGWTYRMADRNTAAGGATLEQQVIFHQEYAKANAPARVNHLGGTARPDLTSHSGTDERNRFLPGIHNVTELWAQGYSGRAGSTWPMF